MATGRPTSANASAVSRPIPDPPPVISTPVLGDPRRSARATVVRLARSGRAPPRLADVDRLAGTAFFTGDLADRDPRFLGVGAAEVVGCGRAGAAFAGLPLPAFFGVPGLAAPAAGGVMAATSPSPSPSPSRESGAQAGVGLDSGIEIGSPGVGAVAFGKHRVGQSPVGPDGGVVPGHAQFVGGVVVPVDQIP